jgi:hypothetical protein
LGQLVGGLAHQPLTTAALLEVKPVRSELVYLVVSLDKEYTAPKPGEPWEAYYAQRILRHFNPAER